jgi:hypothetical protein
MLIIVNFDAEMRQHLVSQLCCALSGRDWGAHPASGRRRATDNPQPSGNPGALDGATLAALIEAAQSQSFAVKAHVPPNSEILEAVERDQARMIFIIRHPVDIVRSTLAYGEFCRAAGWDEPYRELYEPEDAARFVAPFVEWAVAWRDSDRGRVVARYEDLFADDLAIRQAAHRLEPRTELVSAQKSSKRCTRAACRRTIGSGCASTSFVGPICPILYCSYAKTGLSAWNIPGRGSTDPRTLNVDWV